MNREVYLDANATHPLLATVRQSMASLLLGDASGELGNPSSSHSRGRESRKILNTLKSTFLQYLKRPASECLLLTSGATESINMILRGLLDKSQKSGRKIVFWTTAVEHASVLATLKSMGATYEMLKVDTSGQIPDSEWQRLWSWLQSSQSDLCLTVQTSNNETGVCFDLRSPLKKLKEVFPVGNRKFWVHLDMAQSVGKLDENDLSPLMDLAHFGSVSAHKFGAPSGIGALWCKNLGDFSPILTGGGQEEGLRSGTWNALGAYGFLEALKCWISDGISRRQHMRRLQDRALARLEKIPGFRLHGEQSVRERKSLPNTLNFSFTGHDTDTLLPLLDMNGFRLSGTSACSSGAQKSSHVLLAMGYGEREAKNSIRMSVGCESVEADVDAFCDFLASKIR